MKLIIKLALSFSFIACINTLAFAAEASGSKPVEVQTNWSAVITPTPFDLAAYGPYLVKLTFPTTNSFTVDEIINTNNYSLYETNYPVRIIPIKKAVVLGGGPGIRSALLFPAGNLLWNQTYYVIANFTNGSSGKLTAINNPIPSGSTNFLDKIVNFGTQWVNFSITPQLPFDSSKSLALEYSLKIPALGTNWNSISREVSSNSRVSLEGYFLTEGTVKLKSSDTNVADFINLSAVGDGLYTYLITDPLDSSNEVSYFIGIRMKALNFEADQQFKVVNLTVQPELCASIPYTDYPGGWWQKTLGIYGNIASPLTVYAGYSFVDPICTDTNIMNKSVQSENRFNVDLEYTFPLTSQISVGVRDQEFYLEKGQTRGYVEAYAAYAFKSVKNTSLVAEYTSGSLPPKFQHGHEFSLGYNIKF